MGVSSPVLAPSLLCGWARRPWSVWPCCSRARLHAVKRLHRHFPTTSPITSTSLGLRSLEAMPRPGHLRKDARPCDDAIADRNGVACLSKQGCPSHTCLQRESSGRATELHVSVVVEYECLLTYTQVRV